MALLTVTAQLHPMRCILSPFHMAVDALSGIALKSDIRMALTAGESLMYTYPKKVIQKMAIGFYLREGFQGMTGFTGQLTRKVMPKLMAGAAIPLFSPTLVLALVFVVFGMAGKTAVTFMLLIKPKALLLMDKALLL